MLIIYSPEYASGSFVDLQRRKGQLLGMKVCGSNELLSELELRLGIVSQDLSESERLIAFHESLNNNIHGTVFEESFKTDEVGVARQLMGWCDNLLMEGWTPNDNLDSDKLRALASFVAGVNGTHIATRWNEVTQRLKNQGVFGKDDTFDVHDQAHIPAVIMRALEELAKQATVHYVAAEGEFPKSVECYRFKSRMDAYRWYLSQPEALHNLSVTVSSDNCMLNDMAMAMGRPVVDSTAMNSNPQLLQLFKLGMSLFVRPLNVYNLLSYLQVPGNPLGGVSYKLAQVLLAQGGINEKWRQTIDEYDFTDEKGQDRRQEKLAFIDMIGENYDSNNIPVPDIKNYANNLAHWSDGLLRVKGIEDERKEQLVVLASFCRSLHQILPSDGFISSDALKSHVEGIYRPQSFTHRNARKDAPDIISSVTQLADDAAKVCWLGCVGGPLPAYPFDFLNTTELGMLQQKGILIPGKSVFYTRRHLQEMNALKHVKHLILVTWDFDGNTRQEEHPLVIELRHQYKENWTDHVVVDAVPNLQEASYEIVTLEPQLGYELSDGLKEIKREKESYTSISTLIQHPFDYTLNHLLHLRDPQVGRLPDLDTTKGLVAHLYVERLYESYGEKMAEEYRNLDQSCIKAMMDNAIQQKGAVLLLPEYKLVRQQFETLLGESIKVLMSIISKLCLKPVGSEVEVNVDLDAIGAFNGNIDMVLKNANGHLVIFDFKWSEAQHYRTDLEENKAMQLELYREAASKHYNSPIAGVAYYLFPKMTLFTTDFPESVHVHRVSVKETAAAKDLYAEIQNSYKYRREELNRGVIEDSEMEPISELEYTKAGSTTSLYPLNEAYNNKGRKSCPYVKVDQPPFSKKKASWNKNQGDSKEIPTTHPILKGRLV